MEASVESAKYVLDTLLEFTLKHLAQKTRELQTTEDLVLRAQRPPRPPLHEEVKGEAALWKDVQQEQSVDDVEVLLGVLAMLDEQLWARVRSKYASRELKQFVGSTNRNHSALFRLSSFVNWPFADSQLPIELAERGFLYKETNKLAHF